MAISVQREDGRTAENVTTIDHIFNHPLFFHGNISTQNILLLPFELIVVFFAPALKATKDHFDSVDLKIINSSCCQLSSLCRLSPWW